MITLDTYERDYEPELTIVSCLDARKPKLQASNT